MKQYKSPTVEILSLAATSVLALSLTPEVGGKELSNRLDASSDTDWDDE